MSHSQPPESESAAPPASEEPAAPLASSEIADTEADTDADESGRLRLLIVPVIERADEIVATVGRDLPGHPGLSRAASAVADAARTAESVARRLRRWWGVHRLPALFLFLALAVFVAWMYWQFLHTSKLVIAISSRDAVQLRQNVDRRVQVVSRSTTGSRDSIQLLIDKQADLAFVQGGVDLPPQLIATELESAELVLLLLREGRQLSQIRTVLTSSEGQGSHSLAQKFIAAWGIESQVRYVHDWRVLTEDDDYHVASEVDAIFVVKDPTNERVTQVAHRLQAAGFRLTTPDIGAASLRMEYLEESVIRPGYLDPLRQIPPAPVPTYVVSTYLVARPGLTPRQMAAASHLRDAGGDRIAAAAFEPTVDTASEVAQGVEAVLSILIYIGLAFLAILGLDIVTYRRHFNELNSLVSLISMHQSTKDTVVKDAEERQHNIAYLRVCSDLLSLIAVITNYYTQENPSLLYNRLLEVIHDRCDGLKINIQLKILHGVVESHE